MCTRKFPVVKTVSVAAAGAAAGQPAAGEEILLFGGYQRDFNKKCIRLSALHYTTRARIRIHIACPGFAWDAQDLG